MGTVSNKSISKTYVGKEIEGKGHFVNFYLEGGKKKFGYFVGKGKRSPKEGDKLALVEWEEVQDGQFTNNKVKKLVWVGGDDAPAKADSKPVDKNSPVWFCLSYAKDIQAVRLEKGMVAPDLTLIEIMGEVVDAAQAMLYRIDGKKTEEKKKDAIAEAQGVVDDSEIPF